MLQDQPHLRQVVHMPAYANPKYPLALPVTSCALRLCYSMPINDCML
jgi:hypothetical protein